MNIDELREAIEIGEASYGVMGEEVNPDLVQAAKNWLAILEADPELVERIAKQRCHYDVPCEIHLMQVRDVLTAISTPTPGAE